jgi:hypothetical protein
MIATHWGEFQAGCPVNLFGRFKAAAYRELGCT